MKCWDIHHDQPIKAAKYARGLMHMIQSPDSNILSSFLTIGTYCLRYNIRTIVLRHWWLNGKWNNRIISFREWSVLVVSSLDLDTDLMAGAHLYFLFKFIIPSPFGIIWLMCWFASSPEFLYRLHAKSKFVSTWWISPLLRSLRDTSLGSACVYMYVCLFVFKRVCKPNSSNNSFPIRAHLDWLKSMWVSALISVTVLSESGQHDFVQHDLETFNFYFP